MIKQALIEGFRKSASMKREKDGIRVFKNDLITDFDYDKTDDKLQLTSTVISEDLYNQYSVKLDIDTINKELQFAHCSCDEFEKYRDRNNTYCCKHIIATFYKFIDLLDVDPSVKVQLGLDEKKENLVKKTEGSILDYLLDDSVKKQQLKIEVIINKNSWSDKISAEFKIGTAQMKSNKLLSIKDIDNFLLAMYNKISIPYGKEFIFDLKKQKFTQSQNELISFIKMIKDLDLSSSSFRKSNEKFIQGKNMMIPNALLREFLKTIKDFRVYLGSGFYSRLLETEVILDKVPIALSLKEIGDMIKLEANRGLPEHLGECEQVYLYDAIIYIPPLEQVELLNRYIEAFSYGNTLLFSENEEERVLKQLIPSMQKVTDCINLSNRINNKIVIAPVKFKFYFDKKDEVILTLKVCYGEYEFNYFDDFNKKVIYRDVKSESNVIQVLRELGFEPVNDVFMFFKDDDYIFTFFKEDILRLHELGEVYYSENFTGIKKINKNSFIGHIKKGRYDYFEMNFKIKEVSDDETYNILKAFRENKKYYKLKNGEFLDLQEIEMNRFLKLLDVLENDGNIENNTIKINNNKAIFTSEYIEGEKIDYIKGTRNISSIKNSLKKIKSSKFDIPTNINANLRQYQKEGFYYLKTLDELGFGGILGDEMGLGKTLQSIVFIASNVGKKTLIIAPTSLVYNWGSEFKKFAPTIKVALLCGDRSNREQLISESNKYDVFITTYNLLKRDMDLYKDLFFDYMIIDEAQNIKNHQSQNAKAVKEINSKTRFALSGTPMENSLMELWSIFDFIMPGYLYDEKRFMTRYYRRLDEDQVIIDEINKLINPFILRRYKKDVIKELPEKIEKKMIIPMDEDQQKVYETYSKYAKSVIEKKVKEDEFKKSKIEILSYITKLRQICLDPSVIMDDYVGGSAKIDALIDTILESTALGHKILVFSQFTSVLKNIEKKFKFNKISYYYLDGSTSAAKRNELVDKFNNDNTSVFLISLKAGGTGLNLTSADIVIHFDPWWNPAVEDQASDRAHRIGQKNVVEVIKMISEGTIEEKIIDLQESKKELISKIIDSGEGTNSNIVDFSEEEILSLFIRG